VELEEAEDALYSQDTTDLADVLVNIVKEVQEEEE